MQASLCENQPCQAEAEAEEQEGGGFGDRNIPINKGTKDNAGSTYRRRTRINVPMEPGTCRIRPYLDSGHLVRGGELHAGRHKLTSTP